MYDIMNKVVVVAPVCNIRHNIMNKRWLKHIHFIVPNMDKIHQFISNIHVSLQTYNTCKIMEKWLNVPYSDKNQDLKVDRHKNSHKNTQQFWYKNKCKYSILAQSQGIFYVQQAQSPCIFYTQQAHIVVDCCTKYEHIQFLKNIAWLPKFGVEPNIILHALATHGIWLL